MLESNTSKHLEALDSVSRVENTSVDIEELSNLVAPSKDYLDGKLPISFEYNFVTGEKFKATENNSGDPLLVLEKDGKMIFSFNDYIAPLGYSFVTPRSKLSRDIFVKISIDVGEWQCHPPFKLISIGEMKDPKSIFFLLHELGHAIHNSKLGLGEVAVVFPQKHPKERKKAIISSIQERQAFSEALTLAREIKRKYNIDLLEVFNDLAQLRKYIYASLIIARYNYSVSEMLEENKSGFKKLLDYVKNVKPDADEILKFYRNFFDKGRTLNKINTS